MAVALVAVRLRITKHHGLIVRVVTLECLSLVVGVGVLDENFLTGHVQALQKEVCLHGGDHILLFLRDEVSGFHFKILLVLTFALLCIVAERLLLDAGTDHFLLILSELLIGHSWLGRVAAVALLRWAVGVLSSTVVLLEVLGVAERRCPVKVGLEGSLHVWKLALH